MEERKRREGQGKIHRASDSTCVIIQSQTFGCRGLGNWIRGNPCFHGQCCPHTSSKLPNPLSIRPSCNNQGYLIKIDRILRILAKLHIVHLGMLLQLPRPPPPGNLLMSGGACAIWRTTETLSSQEHQDTEAPLTSNKNTWCIAQMQASRD